MSEINKKVLFLNLPYKFRISRASRWPEKTKSRTLYYPYWLAYAAGLAEKRGFEVLLLDAVAGNWDPETTLQRILEFQPALIVGESTTPTIEYDLDFVRQVKTGGYSGSFCLTGTHSGVLYRQVLESCHELDYVAVGEYDATIPDLMNSQDHPERVQGLAFRKDKEIVFTGQRSYIQDLDVLPFVSEVYHKYLHVEDYFYALARHPMIQIFSSRGCPFRCNFCQYPQTMGGRKYRKRSPSNFVDELEYIHNNMPEIREIFVEDDTFTVDTKRVNAICDLILKRGLKLVWSCNVRADVPFETLEKMRKAGCRLLVVGYESGSQKILDNIKKGITLEQSRQFAVNTKALGFKVFGCFMIGLQGETKASIETTFQFAKETDSDMVFFQQAVPFPGTEFYEYCRSNGMLVTDDFNRWMNKRGQLDCLVDYQEFDHQEIEKIRDRLMSRYYFSARYLYKTFIKNPNWTEIRRIVKAAIGYIVFRLKLG